MPYYLADSSIWGWADSGRRPDIAEKLAERLQRDEIVTCVPVILEVLHRADSGERYEVLFEALFAPLHSVSLGEEATDRALRVQREMAATTHGNHRRPAIDFLIAAAAELSDEELVVWCFDRDLRVICEHTGQPFEAEESSGPGT